MGQVYKTHKGLSKCVLGAFSHVQSTRVMNCLTALCPPWLPAPALNSASLSISGWPSCHMSVTFQAGYHMCRPWPPTLSCRVLCCSKGTVGPDGSHFSLIFSWSHISERKKKSFRGKFIAEIPIFLEMFSIFFLNSTRSIYQSELEAHTSHRYTHQRIFTEFQCLGEAVFSPKDLRGGKLTWLVKLIHG